MKRVFGVFREFVKTFIKLMRSSVVFHWSAILSLITVVLTFLIPLWKILPLSEEQSFLPLHYNIYFGIDQFGPWYYVFFVPSLGLVLLIINLVFEVVFFRKEAILSYFFAFATLFAELILLVAVVLIVLLNL